MLEDHEGSTELSMGKAAEKCKPDYEGMIKRAKEKLHRTANFRDAAMVYLDGRRARNKMAELIGELVSQSFGLERELEKLIEAQENDPD